MQRIDIICSQMIILFHIDLFVFGRLLLYLSSGGRRRCESNARQTLPLFLYKFFSYEEKFARVVILVAAGGGIGILFLAEPSRHRTAFGDGRAHRPAGDGR